MHLKEYHQERKMESLENYIETIEPDKKETKDKIYKLMQQIKDDAITKDELLDKLQDLVFTIWNQSFIVWAVYSGIYCRNHYI